MRIGASVNERDELGCTALRSEADSLARSQRLLDLGADVNAQDCGGMTPLMFAAMNDHSDVMQLLLRRGANAALRDHGGNNALDSARNGSAKNAIALLTLARNSAEAPLRDAQNDG